jgi:hypothetical protein
VDDMTDRHDELDLVGCPECAAPAEVLNRFALPSTDGLVPHATVRCVARHWFMLPVASLPGGTDALAA